jgi:hypothetical protein
LAGGGIYRIEYVDGNKVLHREEEVSLIDTAYELFVWCIKNKKL